MDWSALIEALLLVAAAGIVFAAWMHARGRDRRATRALRASEERFRNLTALSADWFWETDVEHRITWLTGGPTVLAFFGSGLAFGRRLWELPGVELDGAAFTEHLEKLRLRVPFFDLEVARSDAAGVRQCHLVSGQPRYDSSGNCLGYRGVGRDVTERRRGERELAAAKERLELALEGSNASLWDTDLRTGKVYLSEGWAELIGRPRAPTATTLEALMQGVHQQDLPRAVQLSMDAVKGKREDYVEEHRYQAADGEWKWVLSRGKVSARDANGRALRMTGINIDITARKRAEQALAEREQRFRDVVEASGEYVWETDAQWRYTYLSARVEAVLGHMRADLIGRTPRDFMPLGEARALDDWFERHVHEGQPFRDLTHRSITKSGKVIWQQVSGMPVRDAQGRLTGYRGTGADITSRKQAEERIQVLATRDALSGLPNRALLADRAGQAILAAARSRGQLAVLLFDLDRFKLVNDSLGHQAGDALLRAVAERLQNTLRREDTLARLGGDEYVLLWDGLKSSQEAALVAQRIQGILQRPFSIEGRALNVTASIGIAIYPHDGRDFSGLLKSADAAMYHAKDTGRGAFRFFSPELNARAVERLALESDLRGALARGELLLHWQPVVRQGAIVGAEALVRWNHPQRGLLAPDAFIPAAEESGLIRGIGEWTLEHALSQIGAWQRSLPGEPWFALNVSALELAQGEAYVARLREALAAHGVPGARLELEVTERVLMAHLQENIETLQRIGALGVRLAIDDFGTGYSSLAYLRRLPIDKLKIDRAFLRELESNNDDAMIVETIAAMARGLGLQVAAEGVESEAQLRRLLAAGCVEWQGHHFSPPLEAAAFERLARDERAAAAG
jgi:diguanylate cyclase (GGDEF)-like protein/PAS domain S-box-containing protein